MQSYLKIEQQRLGTALLSNFTDFISRLLPYWEIRGIHLLAYQVHSLRYFNLNTQNTMFVWS
jgi:hypothetical protein